MYDVTNLIKCLYHNKNFSAVGYKQSKFWLLSLIVICCSVGILLCR